MAFGTVGAASRACAGSKFASVVSRTCARIGAPDARWAGSRRRSLHPAELRRAVNAARAELDRSRSVSEKARQELDRLGHLVKQGLIAQRDYDQAARDLKTAEARDRVALEKVTQAERDLAQAEDDLRLREAGLEWRRLSAEGRVRSPPTGSL
jgi:multidrug resistance efflux pump